MKKKEFNSLAAKGITMLSAYILLHEIEQLVEKKTRQKLPKEPEAGNKQSWGKAIAYAAFTGAFLGAFKLLVERGTVKGLKKLNS